MMDFTQQQAAVAEAEFVVTIIAIVAVLVI